MFLFREKSEPEQPPGGGIAFANLPYKKQVKQLSAAIKEKQFAIYLQPIVNMTHWSVQGVELLLRWQHPEFGILSPTCFISTLEKSGLLNEVETWVLKKAGHLNAYWLKSGLQPLRLAVNISCERLIHKNFITDLDNLIKKTGIDPSSMEIEVTDQCLFDKIETQLEIFQKIRAMDIKLALKYSISGLPITIDLNELPIDIVNIDKELTHQITSNRENRQIMTTILNFAQQHKLEVVAEGVETAEQLLFLNAMHCNAAQGFLLSHPLSIKDFTSLYQSGKKFDYLIEKISRKMQG